MDGFEDETSQGDSEVEITDLPPHQLPAVLEMLIALSSQFAR